MHIARIYAVGPRNCEVQGGDEIAARGHHERATCVTHEERHKHSCV